MDQSWNYAEIKNQNLGAVLSIPKEKVKIAPWKYCQDINRMNDVNMELVQNLVKKSECSGPLIEHLAWDSSIIPMWIKGQPSESDGFSSRFVVSEGGLLMAEPEK